jgi:hypothetical protein
VARAANRQLAAANRQLAAASLIWRSSLVEIGDEEGEEYGAAGVDGG